MQVVIDDNIVDVEVIRKNNKNIYFRFNNGNLVITCNYLASEKYLKNLIEKNKKALTKMYLKSMEEKESEAFFNYLGESYTILYDENVKKVSFYNDTIITKDEKMLNKFYMEQVRKIFTERVEKLSILFDDIPKFSLRFRKMKTRWGVNNVTNRIVTLNTELLKKEISLLDYVIIHELCHFYEANHSSRFWAQVEKRYPYYKLARKKLRY